MASFFRFILIAVMFVAAYPSHANAKTFEEEQQEPNFKRCTDSNRQVVTNLVNKTATSISEYEAEIKLCSPIALDATISNYNRSFVFRIIGGAYCNIDDLPKATDAFNKAIELVSDLEAPYSARAEC
jgi:hypothetical protein